MDTAYLALPRGFAMAKPGNASKSRLPFREIISQAAGHLEAALLTFPRPEPCVSLFLINDRARLTASRETSSAALMHPHGS